MGMTVEPRKPTAVRARPLVAFDFDGTLTARDSFAAFLRWRTPAWAVPGKLARLAPALIAYLWRRDRGRLKAATLRVFLGRLADADLRDEARRFAEERFTRLMRPDAVAAWDAHGLAGDERVIVTASPEALVAPFAERLGADRLIGTRLAVVAGRVTGELDGANCRGPEKVRRLATAYGPGVRLTAAYGDTTGDRELLALADRPGWRVFTARPAAA